MNTTLRARLLLAISLTIIVTLCITQYGLFVLIRRRLYAEFDQSLSAKARALAAMTCQSGGVVDLQFHHHSIQEFARGIRPEYYQIWHENGDVLARSRQLTGSDLKQISGDIVAPAIHNLTLPDGRPGRIAGMRFRPFPEGEALHAPVEARLAYDDEDAGDRDEIDFSDQVYITLVVARDTLDIEASLASLWWLLLISGVTATVIILCTLTWLVAHSLSPLKKLAVQIGTVHEQNLSHRFQLSNAPGELQPIVSKLNTLMNRLESAFLREKTFTADVAHELRTPLAGIRSTLEVALSRQRNSADYRNSMERCLGISHETETIIGTLLSLSRIEAGQAILENDVIHLNSLLQNNWQHWAQQVAARHVSVQWDCDDELVVVTDVAKLQVVISNLFDNAASYVDDAGTICVRTQSDNGLTIIVSNTCRGISASQVTHVFDRFWRADMARSETGSHCGLGLALTRRIVEFLSGSVQAMAGADCFTIVVELPATTVERESQETTSDGALDTSAAVCETVG